MSAQRLSEKSTRRIATSTGLEITRAWSHGGYSFAFVTPVAGHPERHRHGVWNKPSGAWQWDDAALHYTTCHELFPTTA